MLAVLIAACGQSVDPGPEPSTRPVAPPAEGVPSSPEAAVGGDAVARGEQIYARCQGCHSLDRHRTGPKHCGVIGRAAASEPGFTYSPAMIDAKLTWTPETLDAFLAEPTVFLPGTAMTFAGVSDPEERADLIAFLSAAADDPTRCEAK